MVVHQITVERIYEKQLGAPLFCYVRRYYLESSDSRWVEVVSSRSDDDGSKTAEVLYEDGSSPPSCYVRR